MTLLTVRIKDVTYIEKEDLWDKYPLVESIIEVADGALNVSLTFEVPTDEAGELVLTTIRDAVAAAKEPQG